MDKSWRVIFAFAGIFFAGLVAGVLVAPRIFPHLAGRNGQPWLPVQAPIQRTQPLGPQLFRQFTERLNLTPEQREKIKPIELRVTEELRRLRLESQHNTDVALQRMQDEISEILTPEQRTRFQERIAQSRQRIQNRLQELDGRGRRGGPEGPGRLRDGPPPK
jgi:Spy/CpxP family protein refolding chaperone